jgi:WD40 repeat protein
MRWLKWTLVAAWLGLHALLWTLLPPVPLARVAGDVCQFSADGRQLITNTDRIIREYDVESGGLLREWQADLQDPRNFYAWESSARGRRAVIYNDEGDCVLIDFDSGSQTRLPNLGDGGLLRSIELTPDGRKLVHGRVRPKGFEHQLRIYDIDSGGERLVDLAGKPNHVRIAPDGQMAAVTCGEILGIVSAGELNVYFIDLATGEIRGRDTVRGRWCLRSGFSPDSKYFAADLSGPGFSDNLISGVCVWEAASAKIIARIPDCYFDGWRSDGQFLGRRSLDVIIDPRTGSEQPISPQPGVPSGVEMDRSGKVLLVNEELRAPEGIAALLSWLGAAQRKDYSSDFRCYDLSGRELIRVQSRSANQFATEISPDGRHLAISPPVEDGTINLFDIPPRKPGGIVLGLIIIEVTLVIAWTSWRRRLFRCRYNRAK